MLIIKCLLAKCCYYKFISSCINFSNIIVCFNKFLYFNLFLLTDNTVKDSIEAEIRLHLLYFKNKNEARI